MSYLHYALGNEEYSLKLSINSVNNVAFALYIGNKGGIPSNIISKYYFYKYFL
jgi:hypothetical protein